MPLEGIIDRLRYSYCRICAKVSCTSKLLIKLGFLKSHSPQVRRNEVICLYTRHPVFIYCAAAGRQSRSASAIFLRNVDRLMPRSFAAATWLPSVAFNAALIIS